MFNGMQEIVISAHNLDLLRSTMMDVARWSAHPLPDAPIEQYQMWKVPHKCTRIEQLLLKPENDDRGFIRLVKFHGVDAQLMRPAQRAWDTGGIFDCNVYVHDTQEMFESLQLMGWTAFGQPTDYELGEFSIRQAVMRGPDGMVMVLLQAFGVVLIDLPEYSRMSRTFNALQIVRDYDVSRRFFVESLGWGPLMERVIDDSEEPGRNMLGIPSNIAKNVCRKVGIFHPSGLNDGSVQILEMKQLGGEDFSARCIAPNIGYLSARFRVSDAAAYANDLYSRGVSLYSEISRIRVEPYGLVTMFSVCTPDGAILEFFSAPS